MTAPRATVSNSLRVTAALALCAALSACASSGQGEGRTEPVDMSQFVAGTTRFDVASTMGQPEGHIAHNNRPCDIYHAYTRGLSSGGRAMMAGGEVLTDIGTLGLAELLWAPIKEGTKPNLHTVLFCFGPGDRLVEIYDKNPTTAKAPRHLVVDPALYATPVIAPAQPPATATIAGPFAPIGVPAPTSVAPATATAATTSDDDSETTRVDENGESHPIAVSPVTEAAPTVSPDKIDHTSTDPKTGIVTYYLKGETPKPAPPAGTISLGNLAVTATGPAAAPVKLGAGASTDDLNSASMQTSASANTPALGAAAANPPMPVEPAAPTADH